MHFDVIFYLAYFLVYKTHFLTLKMHLKNGECVWSFSHWFYFEIDILICHSSRSISSPLQCIASSLQSALSMCGVWPIALWMLLRSHLHYRQRCTFRIFLLISLNASVSVSAYHFKVYLILFWNPIFITFYFILHRSGKVDFVPSMC